MITLFLRAIFIYTFVIISMRIMGKQMLGQLQPYEMAVIILIADLAAEPITEVGAPLLHGLLPILGLLFMQALILILSLKSPAVKKLISGKASVLITRGVIDYGELKRLGFTIEDLLEGMRTCGILDPSEVGCAVLEANGELTVFPKSANRSLTPKDMNIATDYEGVPIIMAVDGVVHVENIKKIAKDNEWLKSKISRDNITLAEIALCFINTQGIMYTQTKSGTIYSHPALEANEIIW